MRRPQLKSTFARAVVPVLAGIGFFVVIGLLLWGVAAIIANSGDETTERFSRSFQDIGSRDRVAASIEADGPIILQDLVGDDDNIVLDYTQSGGFQIYLAHPADLDATCQIEQVRGTRRFTDCQGRTLTPEDLAIVPEGVKLINNDGMLTLDLTADEPTGTASVPGTNGG
jgi:hypothetical protein